MYYAHQRPDSPRYQASEHHVQQGQGAQDSRFRPGSGVWHEPLHGPSGRHGDAHPHGSGHYVHGQFHSPDRPVCSRCLPFIKCLSAGALLRERPRWRSCSSSSKTLPAHRRATHRCPALAGEDGDAHVQQGAQRALSVIAGDPQVSAPLTVPRGKAWSGSQRQVYQQQDPNQTLGDNDFGPARLPECELEQRTAPPLDILLHRRVIALEVKGLGVGPFHSKSKVPGATGD